MRQPRALDLFCGAGGAARGLQRAGFYVVGVDIKRQPRYVGDLFIQGDATNPPIDFAWFDFIWASPPCQAYSKARKLQGNMHPELVVPIRELLKSNRHPWTIENVGGSPLRNPAMLCGSMFGLKVHRPRYFETSFPMPFDLAPPPGRQTKMGRPPKDGDLIHVVGHFVNIPYARAAMGIDWMGQSELALAIPPAYSEYIGRAALEHMEWPED